MKIQSVQIRNFKGIKNAQVSAKGNNVYVIARNGMGKTSFIDAIFKILSGKDMPPMPTTQGEKAGEVKIELDDIVVLAKFNEKNQKIGIEITNKEGVPIKEPRTTLNGLVGAIDFDIDKFFGLSVSKQIEMLKQITGIDFTDLDEQYKKAFDERTFVNRKVKEVEAQQKPFDENKVEPIDLTAMTATINEKRKHNTDIDGIVERIGKRQDEITKNDADIAELKNKISELEAKNKELEDINDQATAALLTPEYKKFDIDKEEADFASAIEENKVRAENAKNKELYDEFVQLLDKEKKLTESIETIRKSKADALKECKKLPPGISFDENGLTYMGLPFEASQVNRAQQIIIGLQLQLAMLGDVKIARFDGSVIDDENLDYISEWAEKNDLQLFVEIVDRSADKLKIEVREHLTNQ